VNLTIPDDNYYFVKPVDTARASAVLTVSRPLTKSESLQAARFLCASVKGLTLDNIEISDQNYNSVYSGLQESTGGAGSQYDQELLRKNDIEMKIKVSLSPLFDAVTVINDNLKFNWDKLTETSDVISSPITGSNTGVILKEASEKQTSSSNGNGAAPGIGANDQSTNTYQASNGGASSASNKVNSAEYGYNRTQKTVESASGALNAAESTIAVMVYRNKIYDQSQMNSRLNGQTWEDFKAGTMETALNIDFDPIKDIISKGTGLNAANISVYGYEVPVFTDTEIKPMNIQQIVMFAVLALLLALLALGVMKGVPKEDVTEIEPELSVEDLLETTRMEDAKQAEKARLQEIELDKEPESKKLIEKFVNERPEAVAQLLRNWLNDNWE
jgi:flagellar M-ring protein FliF